MGNSAFPSQPGVEQSQTQTRFKRKNHRVWKSVLRNYNALLFYVTCILGTALIYVKPHHPSAIPGLFFSEKKKSIRFSFSFYTCCLCVCLPKKKRGDSLKMCTLSLWCSIKKDICLQLLCNFDLLSEHQ